MAYTTIDKPTDYFNTVLGTGTGSTQSITGVGFQPDWLWIKRRNGAINHALYDVIRGGTNALRSNTTSAESQFATDTVITFESDGFEIAGGTSSGFNGSGDTFASWNWLAGGTASSNTDGSITSSVSANTTAGFSIVTYTGTGSNATVGHNLGSTPKIVIIKNRSNSADWIFFTTAIDGSMDALQLNLTNAKADSSTTAPTSSVFSIIGASSAQGSSGDNYVAYCFAEKKGYSKFGSYTGNGNADGTFVYTGFKPAFIITKASSTGQSWQLYDNKRNTFNQSSKILFPNLSASEQDDSSAAVIDILSNGFKQKVNDAGGNGSGHTYIYMAFAESPFVTSTGIPTTAR